MSKSSTPLAVANSKSDPLWKEYTPLMKAAHLGDIEAVSRLCDTYPESIDSVGGWNSTSALMLAARAGHLPVVR
jgi:ankyrin repeat protein